MVRRLACHAAGLSLTPHTTPHTLHTAHCTPYLQPHAPYTLHLTPLRRRQKRQGCLVHKRQTVKLAVAQDGRLTAGKLITYQLYWNMMNSAYQVF